MKLPHLVKHLLRVGFCFPGQTFPRQRSYCTRSEEFREIPFRSSGLTAVPQEDTWTLGQRFADLQHNMASFLSLQPRPVLGHRGQRQPVKVAAQAAVEQHRQTAAQPKTVTAPVRYVKPPPPGETLYQYVYDLPEGVDEPDNVHHLSTQVSITDLRQLSTNFSILEQGFQLVPFAVPLDIDWDSTEQVSPSFLQCQA